MSEKNDYQKLMNKLPVYKNPNFKPKKDTEEYTLEKFEFKITEKTTGKKIYNWATEMF